MSVASEFKEMSKMLGYISIGTVAIFGTACGLLGSHKQVTEFTNNKTEKKAMTVTNSNMAHTAHVNATTYKR